MGKLDRKMKHLETGTEVLGIKEYNLNGCRFLYKPGSEQKTIVTFSAFPPKNVEQKYNYIKDFQNKDYTFLSFLDTDLPKNDPRGTYYLSDNLGTNYLLTIHHIIQLLSSNNSQHTYLLGSSKGGVAALLLGLLYDYPNIIVNAPQAMLAEYIKTRSLVILSFMLGNNPHLKELNYHQLNEFLLQTIKQANTHLTWNIHITCGTNDEYHLKALEALQEAFNIANIPITKKLIRGGHDNIAIEDYRKYFATLLHE